MIFMVIANKPVLLCVQLESLSREDLIKYIKKQGALLHKTKSRSEGKKKRNLNYSLQINMHIRVDEGM